MKGTLNVGIDATCWSNARGYGRFTRGLLRALLAEAHDGYAFTLFVDEPTSRHDALPAGARHVVVSTSEAPTQAASANSRRRLRDLWAMATAVSRESLDILFFPSVYSYFPVRTRACVLLGVHDVIAEKYAEMVFPTRLSRRLWHLKGWLGRRQASYLVTVSDFAAQEIQQQFNWPADRLWVVGEAPDPVFGVLAMAAKAQPTLARYGLLPPQRYIIALGGLNPHKNLGLLLQVLANLRQEPAFADVRLLLVGPAEEDLFTPGAFDVRRQVQQLGLAGAVVLTGFIPDQEVMHLLNHAQLLALPSLSEGYGLGAVEAAACGIPVVATCNSPLPEILAGGGLFLDPLEPALWRTALATLLADDRERRRMGAAARARAETLTWQGTAKQLVELFEHVRRAHP